ncbi:MAG: class I tRNA ligase family protein, partial [Promethearchaeota archaeon]
FFDGYNWHEAFTILRPFFWNDICDNYIEAIKYKFYLEDQIIREIALKNALNLFYNILKIFAVIMPFITEEIYLYTFKKFKKLKSIHLEHWPTPYDNLSEELAENGKIGIEIIKILRNYKSKLQIPLNQEVSRVIIISDNNLQKNIKNFKEDIRNTLRIKQLEIFEKNQEATIKDKPDLKETVDELGIIFYFSS